LAHLPTCGSCKYFDRYSMDERNYPDRGRCMIKLPPSVMSQYAMRQLRNDEESGMVQLKDTDSCDLHRPTGKVYIVQRRIRP
jgi:hypothetical protein